MKTTLLLLVTVFAGLFSAAQSSANALHFDGTDDYVSSPLPGLFTNIAGNDFTVEAWINRESAGRIFYAQLDASNFATALLSGANLLFYVKSANVTYSQSVAIPTSGQWVHTAFTWKAASQLPLIYLDGILQTGSAGGSSSTGTNNVMTIGSRSDGSQLFQGGIDEFRIWNTTRTLCEIRSMMHSTPDGAETTLISYYNFNRGTAAGTNTTFTTLPDQVGTNDGTLNNFALAGPTSNWIASGAASTGTGAQPAYQTALSATICTGASYTLGTQTLTTSGTYSEHFTSSQGCDSLVTLALAVHSIPVTTSSVSSCGSYTWAQNNTTYTASGVYNDTLNGLYGCDSVISLNLTVNQPGYGAVQTVSACNSYTWAQNGQTYTASGTYTDTLPNTAGCDSILTLGLTIHTPTYGITQTAVACDSYTWTQNGQTYTVSGSYTDTLVNAGGCDSILTLDLAVYTGYTSSETISHCGTSYLWPADNQLYTASGTYMANLTGIHGCDSTLTLHLQLNAFPNAQITDNDEAMLIGFAQDAVVQDWIDCATGMTVPGQQGEPTFTPAQSGSYAVVVYNPLTNCSDTSDCYAYSMLGLEEAHSSAFRIFPNPADDLVTVSFSTAAGTFFLRDAQGKTVLEAPVENGQGISLAHLAPGVYVAELQSGQGRAVQRVVKR